MARKVIEQLIDDLDGGDAAETVLFAVDGSSYEIDLSKKNAAAFRKALEPYLKVARRRGSTSRSRGKGDGSRRARAAQRDYDIVQLREWAGSNGVEVPSRGRIPQAVVDQYKLAGGR
jgi:hypothetical protein